ncbi:MAG: hypothetical protein FJY97_04895 [candidate division Zixibacteria bacterium]|nr:hypothetical protein [candidate division Zixibacteria bacterium]
MLFFTLQTSPFKLLFLGSPSGLFIFYALIVVFYVAPKVSAQQVGQIGVTMINRSAGTPLAGHPVSLTVHQTEGEAAQQVGTGTTGATGKYLFTGLPADGGHYVVETRYGGIPYMTGHIDLNAGALQHEAELNVFDATTEDADILLNALHLVIDVQQTVLNVTEILVFRNNGARAYAGGGLKLGVPSGSFQLQPMSEGLERTDQGLSYTQPIPPGDAQVVYAYSMDRATISERLTKPIDYPVGRVQVLISPSGQQVEAVNLNNEGVRQIGEKSYLLLSNASGLQRGMSIGVVFPSAMTLQDMMKWAMVALIALMTVGGVLMGRRAAPAEETPVSTIERQMTDAEKEQYASILQDMADLDEQRDTGTLTDKAYRQRRNRLKNRAIRLCIEEREDE